MASIEGRRPSGAHTPGARWQEATFWTAVYNFGAKHYPLARIGALVMYGSNAVRMGESLAGLHDVPRGSKVLDVPCGGGVAFRAIPKDRELDYIAIDLAPSMRRRARREAARLGQRVEVRAGDVEALPFADAYFDISITYLGLHCFADPARAVTEIARVTRPGGQLRGSTIVTGAGRRKDATIRFLNGAGFFGPGGTVHDLRGWLSSSCWEDILIDLDGAVAYFTACRSAE